MEVKPYHHGDLRNELVEAGINLVNEKGMGQFSLRKVAAKCGVSHTAPYSHFKDIDSLVYAMGQHVTGRFMEKLQRAMASAGPRDDVIMLLGKAYIAMFAEHPNYFQFLFYNSGVTINLDDDAADDYPPFMLFRRTVYQKLREAGLTPAAQKQTLIAMWALVHGISALLTNANIQYSGDWGELLQQNTLNCD